MSLAANKGKALRNAITGAMILLGIARSEAQEQSPFPYLPGTAHYVLPESHNNQSGYFSLCEGHDGVIYIGTTAYGENAYLVAFDPRTNQQKIVLDTNKVCGLNAKGYAAQAKLHTRNYVGPSGTIYVGSKQGYRLDENDTADYPGGYVMSFDPRTGESKNLGMPFEGQGIADVSVDESRGFLYVVTCEDQHWMLGEMATGNYREIGPLLTPYAMTLITEDGRAHAITEDFHLASYDPTTGDVTTKPIQVDGKVWVRENSHSIPTWVLSADKKSAYLLLLNHSALLEIPLDSNDTIVQAKNHGELVKGNNPDSRCGMDLGADGNVYAVIRIDNETGFGTGYLHHLARFNPASGAIEDLGVITVSNPDFFDWNATTADGKPLPWTHGYHRLPDETLTPLHAHMALKATGDNTIYVTIIYPFTLLQMKQFQVNRPVGGVEQMVEWSLQVTEQAAENMPKFSRVAQIIAERHAKGGLIGFPLVTQALAQELWGRSGGMVHIGFDRSWIEERTDEQVANDVAIVGFDRAPADGDKTILEEFRARGGYVVGFGPKRMAALSEIMPLCDAWFDSGFGDDDRVVAISDMRKAGHGNVIANAIHGHTLIAEIVGALTRMGHMPTMWKSYSFDDGREWGDKYFRKKQFHDDFVVEPKDPGELGRTFLSQIQYPIRRIGAQADRLRNCANRVSESLVDHDQVFVAWQGHMPMSYLGKRPDDQWANAIELHPFLDSQVQNFQKSVPDGSFLLSLGYHGLDPIASSLWEEMNLRVIHLMGDHESSEWMETPDFMETIDLGFAFGDACVMIEDYPIRICAPSGIAQAVAFESICVELAVLGK